MPGPTYADLADRLSEASAANHPFVANPGLTLAHHEAISRLLHEVAAAMRALADSPDGAVRLVGMFSAMSDAIYAAHLADSL